MIEFIEILKVVFYGFIEGITEWLPISSTGHLILIESIINLNVSEKFLEMFRVVIQLGAILAVVWLYFNKLNPFSSKKTQVEKNKTWSLWLKVIIATIPAAIIGLFFDDFLDKYLYNSIIVAIMLILVGIVFLIIESKERTIKTKDVFDITFKLAIFIGLFQILSLIPGTSRSGITIIGGLLLGLSRASAAEFTFFLGIPVMFGASFLKIMKFDGIFTSSEILILIIGSLTAFITSILAIKFLINYIKQNNFKIFGYYRIILGIIVLLYFFL